MKMLLGSGSERAADLIRDPHKTLIRRASCRGTFYSLTNNSPCQDLASINEVFCCQHTDEL